MNHFVVISEDVDFFNAREAVQVEFLQDTVQLLVVCSSATISRIPAHEREGSA